MSKKFLVPVVLGIVLVLAVAGVALAQGATPPAQGAGSPTPPGQGAGGATPAPQAAARPGNFDFGLKFRWTVFDAAARALNLTPVQLFEDLHNGQTVAQIAQSQGVDLQTVKDAAANAAKTARDQAIGQAISQAETANKISADQANWLRQGVHNNWLPGRLFGARINQLKTLLRRAGQTNRGAAPVATPGG